MNRPSVPADKSGGRRDAAWTGDIAIQSHTNQTSHRRSIRRTVTAALLVVGIGTCGYMWIEGWSLTKSLFFTLITLTTVGYDDYGISETSMRFTAVLLVIGLGVFTYAVSQLAPILFNEKASQERRMKKQIARLKDHYIICGLGRVGQACCRHLAMQDIPFVCIDPDDSMVLEAIERGHLALGGDATHDDVLEQTGIKRARGLAALTHSDTENIVITLGARQMNPSLHIISRADEPNSFTKMKRAGASRVISPIQAGGESIAHAIIEPTLSNMLDAFAPENTSGPAIRFVELTIRPGSSLEGKTIREAGESHERVVFVAITKPGMDTRIHPPSDECLAAGDVLIAAGDVRAIGCVQHEAEDRRKAA